MAAGLTTCLPSIVFFYIPISSPGKVIIVGSFTLTAIKCRRGFNFLHEWAPTALSIAAPCTSLRQVGTMSILSAAPEASPTSDTFELIAACTYAWGTTAEMAGSWHNGA